MLTGNVTKTSEKQIRVSYVIIVKPCKEKNNPYYLRKNSKKLSNFNKNLRIVLGF